MPADHRIRGNPLFKDASILNPLINLVRCDYADPRVPVGMTATGIPPHVAQLRNDIEHAEKMSALSAAVSGLPEVLSTALTGKLEEFATQQGNITQASLEQVFQNHISELQAALEGQQAVAGDGVASAGGETSATSEGWFVWQDGKAYRLPEDFAFQKGMVKDALRIWYMADSVTRRGTDKKVIPPLRLVNRKDFKLPKHKNKFNQVLKPLVAHLETLIKMEHPALIAPETWNQQPYRALTKTQFDLIWDKAKTYFPDTTAKGYAKSRPTEVSMSYAAKILRQRVAAIEKE